MADMPAGGPSVVLCVRSINIVDVAPVVALGVDVCNLMLCSVSEDSR